jgi:hypothetical protein
MCCSVLLQSNIILSFTDSIIMECTVCTICASARHGKEEVDGLQGVEKTYADSIFAWPGQLAEVSDDENADIKAPTHWMEWISMV